ncbi:MAG: hypothetical protein QOE53_1749 [Pseudonocardiales bacterium]|jgi:hypothetical protein|nr:hypothetical protein [Pseudonocardiales bacterium]
MPRFSRGDRVVLRAALRRGRRHKYGRARVRKGATGQVLRRHTKLLKQPRYDVDFRRRSSRAVTVRKVPAASLRRQRSPLTLVLAVLIVLLVIGYLSQHA